MPCSTPPAFPSCSYPATTNGPTPQSELGAFVSEPAALQAERAYLISIVEDLLPTDVRTRPWATHGTEWKRTMAHVAYRLARSPIPWAGGILDAYAASDFEYGLSAFSDYVPHLKQEIAANADRPLWEALRDPPPQAFTEFAEQDVRRATADWRERQPPALDFDTASPEQLQAVTRLAGLQVDRDEARATTNAAVNREPQTRHEDADDSQ